MYLRLLQQSVIPLFLAVLFIGLFYFQFLYTYPFLIENFREEPLFMLYSHLFLYAFVILVLFTTLVNTINHFFIKSKVFVISTLLTLSVFYMVIYPVISDLFNFLLEYKFDETTTMGIVFFIISSLGYILYSLIIMAFKRFIPLSHTLFFLLVSLLYSALFINYYCYPIGDFFNKF